MGLEIEAIFRRLFAFALARPLLMALPFACTLLYGVLGPMPRAAAAGFTLLNTAAMLVVTVYVHRWWRFDGDHRAVMRLDWRVLWGVIAMMTIQLTDEFLLTSLGNFLAVLAGGGRSIFIPAALLLWLFISIPLFPWYVALFADDHDLTLRRAFAAIRPIWFSSFALVLLSLLPLLLIGMALRVLRMRYGGPVGIAVSLADAALVPLLIVNTASAYFAVYLRAKRAV